MARKLKPYRQGALDGLCGPYSIVNAIRFALHTRRARSGSRASKKLSDHESGLLFSYLIDHLVSVRGNGRLFVQGVGRVQMSVLLRAASVWLTTHWSVKLSFSCPFRRRRVRTATMLNLIARHLAEPGTAAIIAGNDPWHHWTVVTKVTKARLMLFDSEGDQFVPIDPSTLRCIYHAGLVSAPDLHLLTVSLVGSASVPATRRAITKGPARGGMP